MRSRRLPSGGADRPQQRRDVSRDVRLLRVLHELQIRGVRHALSGGQVRERTEHRQLKVAEVDRHLRPGTRGIRTRTW